MNNRKLIYADEIKEKLSNIQFAGMGYYKANKAVDECTAVDAVGAAHGRWLVFENHNDIERCSVCGMIYQYPSFYKYNYCPNCGAKMDGDENG